MISFKEAYRIVLDNTVDLGTEMVLLAASHDRILAEDVHADRNFPPFDRVTRDGIAIDYTAFEDGHLEFKIEAVAAAGSPSLELLDNTACIEVMTGAILPKNTDTVIMYEHLQIKDGLCKILEKPQKGQNIHYKGSDEAMGSLLLAQNQKLTAAAIGVLASVGKAKVLVKKMPKVAIISTGDELVGVHETPEPHQIRESNSHTLQAALKAGGMEAKQFHFKDSKDDLEHKLLPILQEFDALLLSGGVSKGKFDFLPKVFEDLGATRLFHRVAQRPGKPFWFGKSEQQRCAIFAFPGNPASTFACFHRYFMPWLQQSLGTPVASYQVILEESFENQTELTRFVSAKAVLANGRLTAKLIMGNGSGDLTSLNQANGFILFEPRERCESETTIPFFPTKRLL